MSQKIFLNIQQPLVLGGVTCVIKCPIWVQKHDLSVVYILPDQISSASKIQFFLSLFSDFGNEFVKGAWRQT